MFPFELFKTLLLCSVNLKFVEVQSFKICPLLLEKLKLKSCILIFSLQDQRLIYPTSSATILYQQSPPYLPSLSLSLSLTLSLSLSLSLILSLLIQRKGKLETAIIFIQKNAVCKQQRGQEIVSLFKTYEQSLQRNFLLLHYFNSSNGKTFPSPQNKLCLTLNNKLLDSYIT